MQEVALQLGVEGWVRTKWAVRGQRQASIRWKEQGEHDMTLGGNKVPLCQLIWLLGEVGDTRTSTTPQPPGDRRLNEKRIWHGPQLPYVEGPSTQQGGTSLTSPRSSGHPAQALGEEESLGGRPAWVQVPALALTTCVLLGMSLRLSEPQFPHP